MQDLDSTLDRLRRRRTHLPEAEAVAELQSKHTTVSEQLVFKRTDVEDLGRAQRKADADVEQVKTRRARNQDRLDKGQVGSPRDLENLQHEIETLDRRISELEDEELEVMESLETAEAGLHEQDQLAADLLAQIDEQTRKRDEAYAAIDADMEQTGAAREKLVAELPEELVTLYERIRTNHSGVGAAELVHKRCSGCQLELNPSELRDIAAAADDDVVRCEECSRILVRTGRS